MVWGLEKGQGMVAMSEKLRNWEPKESHKKDKLNIAIFKLIGQKLHIFGTKPTKDQQINSNKNRSLLSLHFGALHPFCLC